MYMTIFLLIVVAFVILVIALFLKDYDRRTDIILVDIMSGLILGGAVGIIVASTALSLFA